MKVMNYGKRFVAAFAVAAAVVLIVMAAGCGSKQPAPRQPSAKAGEWTCSMHPQIRLSRPGKCPICGMDLIPRAPQGANKPPEGGKSAATLRQPSAKAGEWTCSMHPQFRLSRPGKCPICGMDLIPRAPQGANKPPEGEKSNEARPAAPPTP